MYSEFVLNGSIEQLPVTNFSHITSSFDIHGEEACLLQSSDFVLLTSGSTDKPKRLHYTWNDIRSAARIYHDLFLHLGLDENMRLWEMSAWIPFMSGPLSQAITETYEAKNKILFSPITDQNDVIKAFRTVSKNSLQFDIVSMPVLFFYLLHQTVYNPDFIHTVVKNSVHNRIPDSIVKMLTRIMGRGIDAQRLRESISPVRYVVCSAAPVAPYQKVLDELFPAARIIDLWASTENACMGLKPPGANGHYLLIQGFVPEILPTEESRMMLDDPGHQPRTILLKDWREGDQGELVVSRMGDCLPLLRYRTGDHIEVIDPCDEDDSLGPFRFLPLVRLKGRTAERLDFFDPEQWGPYHGDEIHFSDIEEVLKSMEGIAWWELYATQELPRRLVLLIINEEGFQSSKEKVLRKLLSETNQAVKVFEVAQLLGELEIDILPYPAYKAIRQDIDRLSKERGASRVKPRRLFTMKDEAAIESHLRCKYGNHQKKLEL